MGEVNWKRQAIYLQKLFSECGLSTNDVFIIRELVKICKFLSPSQMYWIRNSELGPSNLCFNKPYGRLGYILKFENHWTIIYQDVRGGWYGRTCKGDNSLLWGQKKLLREVISKERFEGLIGIGQAKGRWSTQQLGPRRVCTESSWRWKTAQLTQNSGGG